jgi:hypothetical protein
MLRFALFAPIVTALAGCPADEEVPETSTHVGLISVQDATLAGAPELGHGLTVTALLTPAARAPDFDEEPGEPTGCKAWSYDLDGDAPPAPGDEGTITVTGAGEPVPNGCVFRSGGYACPVVSGTADGATVSPAGGGAAAYDLPGAALDAEHAGRYLEVGGATQPGNAGRFPIVAVPSPTTAVVGNPGAVEEPAFTGAYTVLAGAGPVPNNPRDPIGEDDRVTIGIEPRDGGHFAFPATTIEAGGAFAPDAATLALLRAFPIDGGAVTLRCDGDGGDCGVSDATVMLLRTTDAALDGLSPFALPPPSRRQVEIVCATLGGDGSLAIPEEALALLAEAHAASPITRIRVAYMREGVAIAENPEPGPANPVRMAVGHGVIGFSDVGD